MIGEAGTERESGREAGARRRSGSEDGVDLGQLVVAEREVVQRGDVGLQLRDERMTSLIIGASSVEQLETNVAALDNLELSQQELDEIDAGVLDL